MREYDKVARQCAAEGVDHVRYLLPLAELEMIDREQRLVERCIGGPFPCREEPRQLRLQPQQGARATAGAMRIFWRAART